MRVFFIIQFLHKTIILTPTTIEVLHSTLTNSGAKIRSKHYTDTNYKVHSHNINREIFHQVQSISALYQPANLSLFELNQKSTEIHNLNKLATLVLSKHTKK